MPQRKIIWLKIINNQMKKTSATYEHTVSYVRNGELVSEVLSMCIHHRSGYTYVIPPSSDIPEVQAGISYLKEFADMELKK